MIWNKKMLLCVIHASRQKYSSRLVHERAYPDWVNASWQDSSVVRALLRITRGPGFDPKLRCLKFSVPMPVLFFFHLVCWNGQVQFK